MSITGTLDVTEIHEGTKVCWEIPRFLSLHSDSVTCSPGFKFLGNNFCLEFDPTENNYLVVCLKINDRVASLCDVMCTFGIRKIDGSLIGISSSSHTFSNFSKKLSFPKFYKSEDLFESEHELLPSNKLTIVCKLEQLNDSLKLKGFDLLSENMKGLLMNKEFCDVTLNVTDKKFKTHKCILAARSPVFAAMFKHETSEKQTGIVNITDCDPESFQDFLTYLYSGEFEDISFRNALHLYKTADKYNVQELKDFCTKFLSKNLKVENFCDAAILAKEFDEKNLLASVQNFFNRNLKEIFASEEWKAFFSENSCLANKLLLEMAMKVNITEE